MRLQQDLQVALRERYRRCLIQGYETLPHETALTRDWIHKQPALAALLEDATRAEPDLDVDQWVGSYNNYGRFSWTSKSEAGRARLAWAIINAVADYPQPDRAVITYRNRLGSSGNLNDNARELVERIYQPFFDYLIDHVAAESSVLFILDRFVRNVEWFIRDRLYAAYAADTPNGEAIYDRALRQFLFSEGINMPYSQVKSASGVSDVLSDLESEDPLVCEVKLFTDDKRSIAGGLHHAVLYAQDYSKTSAYLVIMNLSGRPLQLPTDGNDKQTPRYLDVSGVRVYLTNTDPRTTARHLGQQGRQGEPCGHHSGKPSRSQLIGNSTCGWWIAQAC